ncbi:hypothetical protein MIR68_007674 [Amoeboaphelidium protococcarum]|nr:hypothetical protein MIR68_007674 [Amoeboaphelidium protococcarum]
MSSLNKSINRGIKHAFSLTDIMSESMQSIMIQQQQQQSQYQNNNPQSVTKGGDAMDTADDGLQANGHLDTGLSPGRRGSNTQVSPQSSSGNNNGSKSSNNNHQQSQKCAVFWDYENCPPPQGMPGYVVVDNLRQVIHHFGHIAQFKAYLEINDVKQSSAQQYSENYKRLLRSELQSSGVSLTDVPHNGQKDAVDKMMMIDMMAFALDHPQSTIVLISGDKDFVYALSVLRNRKFTIVLIVPNQGAHIILKSQANAVLEWKYDVLNMDVWNIQQQQIINESNISYQKVASLNSESSNYASMPASNVVSPQNKQQVNAINKQSDAVKSTLTKQPASSPSLRVRTESSPVAPDVNSKAKSKVQAQIEQEYAGPVFSPMAPGFFDLLIEILEKARLAGEPKPRRSRVGSELTRRNPLLYHRVGCSNFKEYIELAVTEGIVTVGGEKGLAWIQLNEDHKDKLYAQ